MSPLKWLLGALKSAFAETENNSAISEFFLLYAKKWAIMSCCECIFVHCKFFPHILVQNFQFSTRLQGFPNTSKGCIQSADPPCESMLFPANICSVWHILSFCFTSWLIECHFWKIQPSNRFLNYSLRLKNFYRF